MKQVIQFALEGESLTLILNKVSVFAFCFCFSVYYCKFLGSQSKGYLNHELKMLQCFCTLIIRD